MLNLLRRKSPATASQVSDPAAIPPNASIETYAELCRRPYHQLTAYLSNPVGMPAPDLDAFERTRTNRDRKVQVLPHERLCRLAADVADEVFIRSTTPRASSTGSKRTERVLQKDSDPRRTAARVQLSMLSPQAMLGIVIDTQAALRARYPALLVAHDAQIAQALADEDARAERERAQRDADDARIAWELADEHEREQGRVDRVADLVDLLPVPGELSPPARSWPSGSPVWNMDGDDNADAQLALRLERGLTLEEQQRTTSASGPAPVPPPVPVSRQSHPSRRLPTSPPAPSPRRRVNAPEAPPNTPGIDDAPRIPGAWPAASSVDPSPVARVVVPAARQQPVASTSARPVFTPPMTSSERIAKASDDGLCVVCTDARADTLLVDCRHLSMCHACAQEVLAISPARCPVCRTTIRDQVTSVIRVFLT